MATYLRAVLLALAACSAATAGGTKESSRSISYLRRRTQVELDASDLENMPDYEPDYTIDAIQAAPALLEGIDPRGYVELDKTVLQDVDESIRVSFELPASALAQTDHSSWTVGIYMRRARPQDGSLEPITALPLCGLETCLREDNLHDGSIQEGHVTFGMSTATAMTGQSPGWPLSLNDYGTGFDVFILDENGSAVTQEPVTFTVVPPVEEGPEHHVSKYDHTHNNYHTYSSSPSATVETVPMSTVVTDYNSYKPEDAITVNFDLTDDLTPKEDWSIGIFMHMANPQGGDLEPIVSLPLCAECDSSNIPSVGDVDFSSSNLVGVEQWPLDLIEYGTGFDVWVLDGEGAGMVGPSEFHIKVESPSGDSTNIEITDMERN
jgi:hypothetical protein